MSARRLVIVDDFRMMTDLLRALCSQQLGYAVVGEAATGGEAVDVISRTGPDLVLLDLNLPGFDGFQVLETMRRLSLPSRVLIFTAYCNEYLIHRVERCRVAGYICKAEANLGIFRQALAEIAEGRTFFSETFTSFRRRLRQGGGSILQILSPREVEILIRIGDCRTDAEIAWELQMSGRTVEKHRLNIAGKLGLPGRIELQRFAREHGFNSRIG